MAWSSMNEDDMINAHYKNICIAINIIPDLPSPFETIVSTYVYHGARYLFSKNRIKVCAYID